ncbi:putative ribonuclease H protein [Acorus calamus]|uniref:Ribonuclease H protein n=1 Tax=Acorus calamus TaxID=4465 RepID=A0AAV9DHI9_ACOCL|nr:putative ribonuclease H protein [Acorus calamus]
MKSNSAPGPDGFNAFFFQHCWEIVGDDVVNAVKEFFTSGRLLKQFNHSFICLVPKEPNADSMDSFRPISLCNTIYKLITKILATRLQSVLPKLVSLNQTAFVQGPSISHGILLAHELVRYLNHQGKSARSAIKVDLRKAFDSIRWPFVYEVLYGMNFPNRWISWIKGCIETPKYSMLINGSPNGFFGAQCGLRQEDPLSPLLFVLVMEAFTFLMDKAITEGRIRLFVNPSINISHLQFTDDLLLFCDGSPLSARGLKCLFAEFAICTGLRLNPYKTQAFYSAHLDYYDFTDLLGIAAGSLPVRYLGLPLTNKPLKHVTCLPLLEKVRRRIEGWKGHLLSFAGRVELAKTVLNSFQIFWSSAFLLPQKTSNFLEKLFRSFIWGGPSMKQSMHHIDWSTICSPRREGGLGLKSIKDWAKATFGAKFWELAVLKYIKGGSIWRIKPPTSSTKIWKEILAARDWIMPQVKFLIFSGQRVNIWNGRWIKGKGLTDWFGADSYIFGPPKLAMVAQMINNDQWLKPHRWPPSLSDVWEQIKEEEVGGHRGIVHDTTCKLCNREAETVDHLFLCCSYSAFIWLHMLKKLGVKRVPRSNLKDFLKWLKDCFSVGARWSSCNQCLLLRYGGYGECVMGDCGKANQLTKSSYVDVSKRQYSSSFKGKR